MEPQVDPKELVRHSYDQISYAYRGDSLPRDRNYFRWLEELPPLLQPGDAVLDLGCGCGVPVAQELAQQYVVSGVDISPVQIERARGLVPQATFICADMAGVEYAPQSKDRCIVIDEHGEEGYDPMSVLLCSVVCLISSWDYKRNQTGCHLKPGFSASQQTSVIFVQTGIQRA